MVDQLEHTERRFLRSADARADPRNSGAIAGELAEELFLTEPIEWNRIGAFQVNAPAALVAKRVL